MSEKNKLAVCEEKRGFDPERVPIYHKLTLTIREAAEYSNIGINKIESLLKQPNCPFVLFVGTRELVKRQEFEEYIRGEIGVTAELVLRIMESYAIIIVCGALFRLPSERSSDRPWEKT